MKGLVFLVGYSIYVITFCNSNYNIMSSLGILTKDQSFIAELKLNDYKNNVIIGVSLLYVYANLTMNYLPPFLQLAYRNRNYFLSHGTS